MIGRTDRNAVDVLVVFFEHLAIVDEGLGVGVVSERLLQAAAIDVAGLKKK